MRYARPAIAELLETLFRAPTAQLKNVFDPWKARSDDDEDYDAVEARKDRLRRHLSAPEPCLLLVGEAPGYKGCRISGVPFTSEAQILDGVIPRLATDRKRLSVRNPAWREPSATVVWDALHSAGIAEHTILWNAFPWHPHHPGSPLSNRTPVASEKEMGIPLLHMLVDALPGVQIAAVGQIAGASLRELGLETPVLRHPANAGAAAFRSGLADLAAKLNIRN